MRSNLIKNSLLLSSAFLSAVLGINVDAIATEIPIDVEITQAQTVQDKTPAEQTLRQAVALETSAAEQKLKWSSTSPTEQSATDKTELTTFDKAEVAAQTPATSPSPTPVESSPASASPNGAERSNRYRPESSANNNTLAQVPDDIGQVTSVSQLSDVQPSDWAYEALRSLVERYGVIAGYPDGTFRGNRAMTRYEFAAALNAALNRIDELIKARTANLVRKEDLETLQRLQAEFTTELATLRGRVDALEARTAELEANQFSTTTKLAGEAIFAVTNAFGDDVTDDNTVLQERVRLNFNTSFTGKDRLITRLQVGNSQLFDFNLSNPRLADPNNRISSVTREGVQTFQAFGDTGNSVTLDTLEYSFPIGENLQIAIAANAGRFDDFTPTLNPFLENFDGGNGSLSTFGQRNPIYRLGGGQGIGVNYKLGSVTLTGGYLAAEGLSPTEGNGLFNGDYSILGQLTWTPSARFSLAFTYLNSYFGAGNFGFDNGKRQFGLTGTAVANRLNGLNEGISIFGMLVTEPKPVVANSYGIEASYQLSPKFIISGWVGLTKARIIDYGDGDIWNYALTFAFPDLGKKGNLGGIIVGAEPYLANLNGSDFFPGDDIGAAPDPKRFKADVPLHVEAFYKYQLTNNISLTPGVIWLTAPNQDNDNSDIVIATLRATFSF